jgi:hypothetical protein
VAGPPPAAAPPNPLARRIAGGHSYGKHVRDKGEFPGVASPDQFAVVVSIVMSAPTANKALSGGRHAYYNAPTNTVVITDPRSGDGGTCFKPDRGFEYYRNLR